MSPSASKRSAFTTFIVNCVDGLLNPDLKGLVFAGPAGLGIVPPFHPDQLGDTRLFPNRESIFSSKTPRVCIIEDLQKIMYVHIANLRVIAGSKARGKVRRAQRKAEELEEKAEKLEEKTEDLEGKTKNLDERTEELDEKTENLDEKTENFDEKAVYVHGKGS